MYLYVIQMHTKTIPARLVRGVTRYPYSHIGLCMERDCRTIYSFGRRSLHNFLKGGFIAEEQNGPFFQKFHRTVCRIYAVEVNRQQYEAVQRRIDTMCRCLECYKYDFGGLFLRLMRIPVSFKNRYVCSQFVADVLEEAQVCHFEKDPKFVRPKDFEGIPHKQEIYEGRYLDYSAEQAIPARLS